MNSELMNALYSQKRLICSSPRQMGVSLTLQKYIADIASQGKKTIALMMSHHRISQNQIKNIIGFLANTKPTIKLASYHGTHARFDNGTIISLSNISDYAPFSHYSYDVIVIDNAAGISNLQHIITCALACATANTQIVVASTCSAGMFDSSSFRTLWHDTLLGMTTFVPLSLRRCFNTNSLKLGDVFIMGTYPGVIYTVVDCTDSLMRLHMSVADYAAQRFRIKDNIITVLGDCYSDCSTIISRL